MVRRWVCGIVVVAVVCSSLGWSAPVMAKEKEPSDYYIAEFLGGEAGLFVVGGVSGVAAAFLTVILSTFEKDSEAGAYAIFGTALFGAVLGMPLGGGLGVIVVGQLSGIEGNLPGAFIGPSLSLIAMVGQLHRWWNVQAILDPRAIFVLPVTLAVIGYNIGAKMKDTGKPASLPWSFDLPVLSLEF